MKINFFKEDPITQIARFDQCEQNVAGTDTTIVELERFLHFHWNTEFYPLNKCDIFTGCYFHTVKSDITWCIACLRFWIKHVHAKTKENVINIKFSAFDVEYGIYFTETGFFHIFTHTLHSWKYNKIMTCLTSEINSKFNVKPLNILYLFKMDYL